MDASEDSSVGMVTVLTQTFTVTLMMTVEICQMKKSVVRCS